MLSSRLIVVLMDKQMETIAEKFASFGSGLAFEDLTPEQTGMIKSFILDWLGSVWAGSNEPSTKAIVEVVEQMGGRPEATLIPAHKKGPGLMAALLNGASSHVVEMDDLHRESVLHPAASILPAIFAAAEMVRAPGKELLVATAVGYEVGIRVALAVGKSHYHYWHTTGTCGTFGAAAGSAKLLGLTEEQFVWSLGSAGTQSAGLWEFLSESAMSKQLHAGKAAMNGLLSALLAREGFTGASKILEGEKGFLRAFSNDFDQSKCTEGLGKSFAFTKNSLKYYPSCGHTHSAIEAALGAIAKMGDRVEEIKQVRVLVYQAAYDLLGEVKPITPYLAKFSLPFCVATAICHGSVKKSNFTSESLSDPKVQELMKKVVVEVDDGLSNQYPQAWPARVEIETRGGDIFEASCHYPKGEPQNPLTSEELLEKFLSLTENIIPPSRAEEIAHKVLHLESVTDVSTLITE